MARPHVKLDPLPTQRAVFATLSRSPAAVAGIRDEADRLVSEASRLAGPGGDHVIAVPHPTPQGMSYRVGWLPEHFYMRFKETGTRHQPRRSFLIPAAIRLGARTGRPSG